MLIVMWQVCRRCPCLPEIDCRVQEWLCIKSVTYFQMVRGEENYDACSILETSLWVWNYFKIKENILIKHCVCKGVEWEYRLVILCGGQFGISIKITMYMSFDPATSLPGFYLTNIFIQMWNGICTKLFTPILFATAKYLKHSK